MDIWCFLGLCAGDCCELLSSARVEPIELSADGGQRGTQYGIGAQLPWWPAGVDVALHAVHAVSLPEQRCMRGLSAKGVPATLPGHSGE